MDVTKLETAQEIFDAVCAHLREQKAPAYSARHGGCMYRGPEDTSCAVGAILTDEEVNAEMRRRVLTVYELKDKGFLPQRLVPHIELLRALQDAHDQTGMYWTPDVGFNSGGESSLAIIAITHGLTYTPRSA